MAKTTYAYLVIGVTSNHYKSIINLGKNNNVNTDLPCSQENKLKLSL